MNLTNKLYVLFLGFLFFSFVISHYTVRASDPLTEVSGSLEDQLPLKDLYVTPTGPVKQQKYVIPVSGVKDANPGIYWFQKDDGAWYATSFRASGGQKKTDNIGSDQDPWPAVEDVTDKINMNNDTYKPLMYQDNKRQPYSPSQVSNAHIAKVKTTNNQGKTSLITKLEIADLYFVLITSRSGEKGVRPQDGNGDYQEEYNRDQVVNGRVSKRPNGAPKKTALYLTPVDLEWRGTIVEHKKIQVTGKQQLAIDEQTQFTAEVATQAPGQTSFGNWFDVTTRNSETDRTEWKSDNSNIATVDPQTGMVTAKAKGTAKITGTWKSDIYWLTASVVVAVDGEELPEPEQEPGVVCTNPTLAGTQTGSLMNGSAVGKIKADERNSEKFEVAKGIPTSESLYGVVQAREYLYNNKFEKFTGTCTFTVPVSKTYNLKWKEVEERERPDGTSRTVTVNKSSSVSVNPHYDIVRPYSYWTVLEMQAFKIDNAKLQNYAFEGGEIVIQPGSSYDSPTMMLETNVEHIEYPEIVTARAPSQTIDGGNSEPDVPDQNLKSYAEAATPQLNVRNDVLEFNGETIMDGAIVKTNGPAPGRIPTPLSINENALFKPHNMIPKTKPNQADNASTGTITYIPLEGSLGETTNQEQPVGNLNPVTVHTPVVMYPSITDDKAYNQRVSPTSGRAALILDRSFTVTMPTSGPHRDIRGFGNRDYAKYVAYKQVLFEFDVYNEDNDKYIPKNTWIDIPIVQLTTTFRMPTWVDEGNYTVHFRSIAENAPTGFTWQNMANTDLSHHVAINTIPVQVIGRLYDFKITDIADYDWETVFRTKKGSIQPTGVAYWVGTNSIDGAKRGNIFPYVLPIRPGSHPNTGYKNVAIKTGYHFKFDFKTKGNMFAANDRVKILPTFYFINKDGSDRQKVDLYYHNQTTGQKFVKIGSTQDTVQRSIILNDRLRNVPTVDISNTAKFVATYGNLKFEQQAKQKAVIGGYSQLNLTQQVRTLIGPTRQVPETVDKSRAIAAEQQWYGEYSLPAAPYVVPAGFSISEYGRTHKLTDKSPIFLRDGYIVVNFNIETYRDGEEQPYLRYYRLPGATTPLDNQWQLEGYSKIAKDRYGNSFDALDGDVAYYHGYLSSYDDFRSNVTH
ncbi:Bacterial Ig-like domain (group 2) [compost metagenome]